MNYKTILEDLQLTLRDYGEWHQLLSSTNEEPKYYFKDKAITMWIKKEPVRSSGGAASYQYLVFKNKQKLASYSNLDDAKKSMMRNMNQISNFGREMLQLQEKFNKESLKFIKGHEYNIKVKNDVGE